jgi:O-acetyl-ADP-ribose deacetylase (regulator of RNase III)
VRDVSDKNALHILNDTSGWKSLKNSSHNQLESYLHRLYGYAYSLCGDREEAKLLESCYRNSFMLALEQGARSIAFPAISTGVYGYPKHQAVEIAVSVMREFEDHFDRIIACCFSAEDVDLYRSVLGQ